MLCAVCVWSRVQTEKWRAAWTVIDGYAVCQEHQGLVLSSRFSRLLDAARQQDANEEE